MTPAETCSDDMLVFRRPHYALRGQDLYFMISRRPALTLSELERRVWHALDAEPNIGRLRNEFRDALDAAVARLVDQGVCELVSAAWRSGRRKILVLEPHSDDAALSVGATMWMRRNECEFTLVTLGGRSNFTSYYYSSREFFDPNEVSALRVAEGELFMRHLGGHYVDVQNSEAPLRYCDGHWTQDWFAANRVSISAFTNHQSSAAELATWKASVRMALNDHPAEEIWFPMGLGLHTDHELARDAVLDTLIEDPEVAAKSQIKMYQDVPYAAHWPRHSSQILQSLMHAGADVATECVSIEDQFERKLELVSIYASQFKISAIRNDIERSSKEPHDTSGARQEIFHHIRSKPNWRKSLELYAARDVVRAEGQRILRWVVELRQANYLRILMLMPAGRYREDMELLLRVYSNATIEVFGTSAAVPESAAFTHPRLRFNLIPRGARSWGVLAMRLAMQRPNPTLCLVADRAMAGTLLKYLMPLSHPIVVPSLDHFMRGFRYALQRAGEPI